LNRIGVVAVCLILGFSVMGQAVAQSRGTIEGLVTLPTGEPAHRVTVLISELGSIVETDDEGRYRFEGVPSGTYDLLAFQSVLNAEASAVVVESGQTLVVDMEMRITAIRQEITVTARGREETTFQSVASVTSLDSFDLAESMAPSIGEVLDGQLGVAKRSFGSGNSRPVVRGFDGDRVLVMQDGVSVGALGAQSGDHGEPIDTGSVERIEVVKGPATLLYGSNAIGGVINAVSTHQAFHDQPHQGWQGQISSAFGTANAQAGGSFNAEYGLGPWMIWAGGGGQRTGDYRTPGGVVANSKNRISNGSMGFGWFGPRAFASLDYQANDGRYGIPFATSFHSAEEGVEGEDQPDNVDIAFRRHNFRFTGGVGSLGPVVEAFEFSLNYSDWNHDEVEIFPGDIQNVGATFENQQYAYRGVFTQTRKGNWGGSFGVQGQLRDYLSEGEEALAPPVEQNMFALFALEELDFERVRMQIGGRVETSSYTPAIATGLPDQRFTGFSGGVGTRVDLWAGGAFVANFTSSSRAPALEELYNFGPHIGNLTFEIGNLNLVRERSNGIDFSLRHQQERVQSEVNLFYYDIDNFVYLAPTGAMRDGLIEADYAQGDVRFLGTELKVDLMLHQNLWFNGALDLVDTALVQTDGPLPRIPPLRARVGFDIRFGGVSVRPEVVMADARNDIFSSETPTAGYTLLDLGASYTVPQQHVSHHLSFDFFNIGNRLYRNHLSFIKDLAPEIGRGIRFSYAAKFF
jgi:iron complex outermembrane receptor protein